MPRDRLAELQMKSKRKVTSEAREDDPEQVKLFLDNENEPISRLQAEADSLRKEMDAVQLNVKLLKQKHNDVIFQGLCSDESKSEINEITDNINRAVRAIRRKLKVIGDEVEKSDKQGSNTEESRIRKIQHMTLVRIYTDIMREYLESQETYKEKCKQLMIRQIKAVNPGMSNEEIESTLEDENPAIFTGDLLAEQSRAKENLDAARELNFQIRKVEQGIIEIHELFQDLATLVNEQGDSINRIEDHVNRTGILAENAVTELRIGKEKQSRSRKIRIIIIVVVLVAIGVVVGVIIAVNK